MFGRKKPVETKPVKNTRRDLRLAAISLVTIPVACFAALTAMPVTGPFLAYAGMAWGSMMALARAALYIEFFARRTNEDGKGNRFTQGYDMLWSRSRLRHVVQWKIENDRREDSLRDLFRKLDQRVNDAADADERKMYQRDRKSFRKILSGIQPNANLSRAAGLGAVFAMSARSVGRGIANSAPLYLYPLIVLQMIPTAILALAQLSMFTIKKEANRTSHALFQKLDEKLWRWPVRPLTAWLLRRQLMKFDRLTISDELARDIAEISLDRTLNLIVERSGAAPKNSLTKIFNAAAALEAAPIYVGQPVLPKPALAEKRKDEGRPSPSRS